MDTAVKIRVRFEPSGRTVEVEPGVTISAAAQVAGEQILHPCAGMGTCRKCTVRLSRPETVGDSGDIVLSCQMQLFEDAVVYVPVQLRVESEAREKEYVRGYAPPPLTPPARGGESDEGAARGGESEGEIPARGGIPEPSPLAGEGRVRGQVEGVGSPERFGLAVDIGTTMLDLALVELGSGAIRQELKSTNPQGAYGADVLSRIGHVQLHPRGIDDLWKAVAERVGELAVELCRREKIQPESLVAASFVGNPTMLHLLRGEDPSSIGFLPFEPPRYASWSGWHEELQHLQWPHPVEVYIAPVVSGYVGGDSLGMALAIDLDQSPLLTLALDIGTNGEILLGSRERILCCAAAAGPAFEGVAISQGMRAVRGAVSEVTWKTEAPRLTTIDNSHPEGFCGTGLVDALAYLLAQGVLRETGAFAPEEQLTKGLRRRLQQLAPGEKHFSFAVQEGQTLNLTQRDIRQLQLAKAAIRAGCEILLREYGCAAEDVQRVVLAGAFGTRLKVENLLRIGMLPAIPPDRFEWAGNAALTGAEMLLVSPATRQRVEQLAREMQYIELSTHPAFTDEFSRQIMF